MYIETGAVIDMHDLRGATIPAVTRDITNVTGDTFYILDAHGNISQAPAVEGWQKPMMITNVSKARDGFNADGTVKEASIVDQGAVSIVMM